MIELDGRGTLPRSAKREPRLDQPGSRRGGRHPLSGSCIGQQAQQATSVEQDMCSATSASNPPPALCSTEGVGRAALVSTLQHRANPPAFLRWEPRHTRCGRRARRRARVAAQHAAHSLGAAVGVGGMVCKAQRVAPLPRVDDPLQAAAEAAAEAGAHVSGVCGLVALGRVGEVRQALLPLLWVRQARAAALPCNGLNQSINQSHLKSTGRQQGSHGT